MSDVALSVPDAVLACPLCGAPAHEARGPLTGGDVVALWSQAGRAFSAETTAVLNGLPPTALQECAECGFGWFVPTWTAPPGFYDEIQFISPNYYLSSKWEYERALEDVSPSDTVLDVGCGAGRFLDLVAGKGARATGIETSPAARAQAQSRGLQVLDHDMSAGLDSALHHKFSVVTAFQVLEHVAEPVAFVTSLVDALEPDGRLILAVPNAHGSLRWVPRAPANLPPHHVTRWCAPALTCLAERLGLTPCRIIAEPMDRLHYDHFIGLWRQSRLFQRASASDAGAIPRTAARATSRGLRGLCTLAARSPFPKTLPGIAGHSVYASFRRRQGD